MPLAIEVHARGEAKVSSTNGGETVRLFIYLFIFEGYVELNVWFELY